MNAVRKTGETPDPYFLDSNYIPIVDYDILYERPYKP
jgi:hypothetical protein